MVHDGQSKMHGTLLICPRQQIAGPDTIARHRLRDTMFELPACFEDEVLVLPQRHRHIAFTYRYLSSACPAAIEVMGYGAAAGVGHEGFESDHFIAHPCRLRWRKNLAFRLGLARWWDRAGDHTHHSSQRNL